MRRFSITEHPSDAGEADCHVASLLAMTSVSFLIASDLLQNVTKTTVIAKPEGLWQSVFLIAKQCVGPMGRQRYPHKR